MIQLRKHIFYNIDLVSIIIMVGMIEQMTITGVWTIILLLGKKRRSFTFAGPFAYTRWSVRFQSLQAHTHIPFGLSLCTSQELHVATSYRHRLLTLKLNRQLQAVDSHHR